MKDTVDALMQMLFKLAYGSRKNGGNLTATDYNKHKRDFLRRGLHCTPYGGNYNRIAGWVVCVIGSPPKGTLTLQVGEPNLHVEDAHYFYGRTCRISNPKHLEIIEAFFSEHLAARNQPCKVDTTPMYA